ncbi:MAG: PAS domain S-box protein [Candidatus Omnitrophica bacterium]|nr:PAS domain S-box protein [Candidatus Omnitrophota bacterium]
MFNNNETENILSKLIDNANVLMLYLDNHGYVVVCNKKVEDITGRRKENIIGSHWLNLFSYTHEGHIKQQLFKAVVDDTLNYKRLNNFESSIFDAKKQEYLIFWSIIPILLEASQLEKFSLIEGVLFIGHDITDFKEKDTALKKIDDTLKNIFTSIKEYALYVANLNGNITYYGMGSETMFGWQKHEIIFKPVSTLHTEHDAKTRLAQILEQVQQTGQLETEIELVKKDGQGFPVALTINRFLDAGGNLSGYIFMAKDITEKKKLEYKVFQTEKLAAIGQLAAGLAHEINNPLFVISGRLELLSEENSISDKLKQDLNLISVQADRIRKLVDQLLNFARKAPPKLETISVNDVVESVFPLLSFHKLPEGKVDIVKEFSPNLPPIKGDVSQLQEVLVNLCVNAHQAMPEGGVLTISTSNIQNIFAQITVSDTGHGIAPNDLKNIFMPFFTTKKVGTGLGLSICYNIIKNHNGTVDIESQVGKGTTFTIRLPFA